MVRAFPVVEMTTIVAGVKGDPTQIAADHARPVLATTAPLIRGPRFDEAVRSATIVEELVAVTPAAVLDLTLVALDPILAVLDPTLVALDPTLVPDASTLVAIVLTLAPGGPAREVLAPMLVQDVQTGVVHAPDIQPDPTRARRGPTLARLAREDLEAQGGRVPSAVT